MPRIGFRCPDGITVTYDECLRHCRMGTRCAPRSFLKAVYFIHREREDIQGHTITEIAEPIRQMMLKKTVDYYDNPDDIDYLLTGSIGHLVLERHGKGVVERRFQLDLGGGKSLSGKPDLYDPEDRTLYDYKFWGAYRVRRVLDEPMPLGFQYDDTGAVTYTDWFPVIFQLNAYRIMLERENYPVDRMMLWVHVRDWNRMIAGRYKLERRWYDIEINKERDDIVLEIARSRLLALETAIQSGWTARCTDRETWGGKRCEMCPVVQACIDMDLRILHRDKSKETEINFRKETEINFRHDEENKNKEN